MRIEYAVSFQRGPGWLIHFTSDVLNRYKIHPNGRTNFEITIGHRVKQATCGFAEKVHYTCTTDKNRRNKMETDWGILYHQGSNSRIAEHLIGTEQGIDKVDTFRIMPDDVAYDEACFMIVNVGYREYVCEGASSGPLHGEL